MLEWQYLRLYFSDGRLDQVDLATDARTTLIPRDALSSLVVGSTVYALTEDYRLLRDGTTIATNVGQYLFHSGDFLIQQFKDAEGRKNVVSRWNPSELRFDLVELGVTAMAVADNGLLAFLRVDGTSWAYDHYNPYVLQGTSVRFGNYVYFLGTAGSDNIKVTYSSPHISRYATIIVIMGYGGNDILENSTSQFSEIYGGTGSEILLGGSDRDRLFGGHWGQNPQPDERDELYGRGGDDHFIGNSGGDLLEGEQAAIASLMAPMIKLSSIAGNSGTAGSSPSRLAICMG